MDDLTRRSGVRRKEQATATTTINITIIMSAKIILGMGPGL